MDVHYERTLASLSWFKCKRKAKGIRKDGTPWEVQLPIFDGKGAGQQPCTTAEAGAWHAGPSQTASPPVLCAYWCRHHAEIQEVQVIKPVEYTHWTVGSMPSKVDGQTKQRRQPRKLRRSQPSRLGTSKYRSKFEAGIAFSLNKRELGFDYETRHYDYTIEAIYTPDFILPTCVVEAKGVLTSEDRRKLRKCQAVTPRPGPASVLSERQGQIVQSSTVTALLAVGGAPWFSVVRGAHTNCVVQRCRVLNPSSSDMKLVPSAIAKTTLLGLVMAMLIALAVTTPNNRSESPSSDLSHQCHHHREPALVC